MTRLNQLLDQMAERMYILDKTEEYRVSHFFRPAYTDVVERIAADCRSSLCRIYNCIKAEFDLYFTDYSINGRIYVHVCYHGYAVIAISPRRVEYVPESIICAIKDYNRSIVNYYTVGCDIAEVFSCRRAVEREVYRYRALTGLSCTIDDRAVAHFYQIVRAHIEGTGTVNFGCIDTGLFTLELIVEYIKEYIATHCYTADSLNDYLERFTSWGCEAVATYDRIGDVTAVDISKDNQEVHIAF